jgi:hypothetical protein
MVVNREKQLIQKFIKWLYRKRFLIIIDKIIVENNIHIRDNLIFKRNPSTPLEVMTKFTEEESLKLIDRFMEEIQ